MANIDHKPIPIRVANKCAYVWDVDDIASLRSQHRICGILAGTLPHLSQQNIFLGVPLLLMPEEVVLLVENRSAVLVHDINAHKAPSTSQLKSWDDERQRGAMLHVNIKDSQIAQKSTSHSMSEEAMRKRKEREAKKAAKAAALQNTPIDMFPEEPPSTIATPEENLLAESGIGGSPIPPTNSSSFYPVIIPAESSTLNWYDTEGSAYSTIHAAKAAGIWDYPSNISERARCGVFRGLWEQGYFLGGGIKFGGEYLVYPGDPLRYHSHFVASVIESPIASLRPMEIVAHGRLGTATKKSHLLCGWDDEAKTVSYFSIEWAGFG